MGATIVSTVDIRMTIQGIEMNIQKRYRENDGLFETNGQDDETVS